MSTDWSAEYFKEGVELLARGNGKSRRPLVIPSRLKETMEKEHPGYPYEIYDEVEGSSLTGMWSDELIKSISELAAAAGVSREYASECINTVKHAHNNRFAKHYEAKLLFPQPRKRYKPYNPTDKFSLRKEAFKNEQRCRGSHNS